MTKVIAVCNQKGGVGKTTTCVNLAASLAALEKRVLLLDLDPQGNASQGLGFSIKQNQDIYSLLCLDPSEISRDRVLNSALDCELAYMKIIPCSQDLAGIIVELQGQETRERRLANLIHYVLDDFDYILLDSPPSLNLLTINILTAADSVLVPIQCEFYALTGLVELLKIVDLVKRNFNPNLKIEGALLTMFDSRLNLSKQVVEEVRKSFQGRVFETVIPRSVKLSEAPSFGKPIVLYDVTSTGAKKYLELGRELIGSYD